MITKTADGHSPTIGDTLVRITAGGSKEHSTFHHHEIRASVFTVVATGYKPGTRGQEDEVFLAPLYSYNQSCEIRVSECYYNVDSALADFDRLTAEMRKFIAGKDPTKGASG